MIATCRWRQLSCRRRGRPPERSDRTALGEPPTRRLRVWLALLLQCALLAGRGCVQPVQPRAKIRVDALTLDAFKRAFPSPIKPFQTEEPDMRQHDHQAQAAQAPVRRDTRATASEARSSRSTRTARAARPTRSCSYTVEPLVPSTSRSRAAALSVLCALSGLPAPHRPLEPPDPPDSPAYFVLLRQHVPRMAPRTEPFVSPPAALRRPSPPRPSPPAVVTLAAAYVVYNLCSCLGLCSRLLRHAPVAFNPSPIGQDEDSSCSSSSTSPLYLLAVASFIYDLCSCLGLCSRLLHQLPVASNPLPIGQDEDSSCSSSSTSPLYLFAAPFM
jgi:hypothetical protein